jgi:hypothetical protein
MLQFSLADGLLLFGMPLAAAIIVALVFFVVARTRVEPELTPSVTLHMNEDGTLSESVEDVAADRQHALAA